MILTRDNYESFFLDYLEGNLSENRIDEFLDFLAKNPDLNEELILFDNIQLPEDQAVFKGKDVLYRSRDEELAASEMKMIAFTEGDLDDKEFNFFEANLSGDQELWNECEAFKKARLIPDTGIIFPYKKQLFKKSKYLLFLKITTMAAAVFLLFTVIQNFFEFAGKLNSSDSKREIVSENLKSFSSKKEAIINNPLFDPIEKKDSLFHYSKDNGNIEQEMNIYTENEDLYDSGKRDSILVVGKVNPVINLLNSKSDPIQLRVFSVRNFYDKEIYELSSKEIKKNDAKILFSPTRIIMKGLNIASDLSGKRFYYRSQNGKIASFECETRFVAFSIPIQKNSDKNNLEKN